ncbi:hypothetical protein ACGC1H_006214 [Rhizoctonia solani]
MLEELRTASSLLDIAITHYIQACSAAQKSCITGSARIIFPRELLIAGLDDEVNSLLNYVSRLRDAGITLASAQNHYKRASASALPPEILAYIFRHVLAGSKCEGFWDPERRVSLSGYPELLSHVCSSWRRAAINSHGLWVHIDLSNDSRLISRSKSYFARSGQLPLYVHLPSPLTLIGGEEDATHIMFIASLAPRIRSLRFVQDDEDYGALALRTLLGNCTPGVLNHVTMGLVKSTTDRFMLAQGQEVPEDDMGPRPHIRLDVPQQHLENILLGLTGLRCKKIYPPWDSKAYHDLTDLHLSGYGEIPESQLVAILNSSSRLRSFEIALEITNVLPITSPVELVHLVDLERLRIHRSNAGFLLRWIAPGSKPLRLMLTYSKRHYVLLESFFREQLQMFFLRSNTVCVSVNANKRYSWLAGLFSAAGSVKELAIDCRRAQIKSKDDSSMPDPSLHLDTLYLLNCHIEIEYFLEFIGAQVIRNIVLWDCVIHKPFGRTYNLRPVSKEEFLRHCPAVKILSSGRSPIKDW